MKILFCLGSMGNGGAERVVSNLSNYFIENNDVSIVVTKNEKPYYELNSKINYYMLDENSKSSNFLIRTIKRVSLLRKILKKIKPDIIISLLPEPTYRLMIAKSFLKIKTIISVRNDPNVEYNSFIKKLLVKFLYTKADGFVFQTIDAQNWFSNKIQRKSVVIPNPINSSFICDPYEGIREKSIVNVGRLMEQKNQRLLIESFYEVSKKHDDYILKIYGDGPLKEDLQELINRYKMNDKIILKGKSNNIKDEIYKAGIFVLSSDYEGMPNALMEAMALGIPSISTDCPIGGPKFLINNKENGLLVKVNDKREMIEAINFLIENNDESIRLGKNANRICDELNPSKINNKWEEYINYIYKK